LQPFLGEASPLSGIYRSDPDLGVDYRSVADFRAQYRDRLEQLEQGGRPQTWAWFGNSFVQAAGMLGDMAQSDRSDVRMFYLRGNAPLFVQVAQLRLLLQSGLKADRVIVVLVPLDAVALARHPLTTISANQRGAIVYRSPAAPAPFQPLLHSSRLALLGWIRGGKERANPSSQSRLITEDPPACAKVDLQRLFGVIGNVCRKHSISATILLLPNREQILGRAGHALQDFERECCRANAIDCLDALDLFADENNKLSLFLPDWHFTGKANRLILDALYRHWDEQKNAKAEP
jgi:hypothetical protein